MIEIEKIGEVTKFRLARTLWGRGFYFTAAYFVDGLMVDSGCAHTARELMATLEGSTVHTVVNTHSHEDHFGANAALQSKHNARLMAHPDALGMIAEPRKVPLKPYQRVLWGYPRPSKASAVSGTVQTERYSFQVLHTPGHSPDHICLYEPSEGWLFTGDAYVGGKDRAIRPIYNIWQIIDSLKKLAALDSNLLFTGSGSIRTDSKKALAEKIEYLEEAGERVIHLHQKGMSRRQIRLKVFGSVMLAGVYTMGDFSRKHLVRSYIEDRAC